MAPVGEPDLLVVGAGVLGLSVAASAAAAGAVVSVLEAGAEVGGAAGAAAFAWASVDGERRPSYAGLRRAALALHARDPDSRAWFHPARALDSRTAAAGLGACAGRTGWVDVAAYSRVRVRRVLEGAGRVRTRARVAGLLPDGVALVGGERLRAGTVVLAAGSATAGLLGGAGAVPAVVGDSRGPRGFLVVVHAPDHGRRQVLLGDGLNVRPAGPDHLALQSLAVEAELRDRGVPATRDSTWPALRTLAGGAGISLPENAFRRVVEADRPMSLDGLPVVGAVGPRRYLVLSHSGITLAPVLGLLAARELAGADQPRLHPFRPDRQPTTRPHLPEDPRP